MSIKARLITAGAGTVLAMAGSIAYYFEGEIFKTYVDPVGVLTSCVGHTGQDVRLGQTFTKEQCTTAFIADLRKAEATVNRCTPNVPESMKPALISFVFNVGEGAYCASTLAKKANSAQYRAACAELLRWDKAAGRVLPGLTKRRKAEFDSCISGVI